MGVHHAWGRTYKDLWQRFFNMKGCQQRFQNGFDNQGLWVEVEVEKDLGFKDKKDITRSGVMRGIFDISTPSYLEVLFKKDGKDIKVDLRKHE